MPNSREEILERLRLAELVSDRLKNDPFRLMGWTPKQWEALIAKARYICICGANQYSGKTTTNTAGGALQYSGRYPENWEGKRWRHPIRAAFASKTLAKLRDTITNKIFGPRHDIGSGWLPKECIDESRIIWSKKEKDAIEFAPVRWFNKQGQAEGWSEVYFFSYDQGWERVSGYTLHDVRLSEEPEIKFHDEMKARTNMTKGQLVIDMIPLLGETELYKSYRYDRSRTRKLITITIDDCLHLSEKERDQVKKENADDPWKECRLYGRPVRGEGSVFSVPERNVLMKAERESWPLYFKVIIGIDIPHTSGAFAAVKIYYDPEKDVIFVVDCVKVWDTPREVQAERLKGIGGSRIPCAWPHDAGRREKSASGTGPVVAQYRKQGCRMLNEPAYMIGWDGKKSNQTMDWVDEVRDREKSGKIWYSPTVRELLAERAAYCHDKGKIVPNQDDHLLDGLGKAVMMLRHAAPLHQALGRQGPGPGRRGRDGRSNSVVRRREVDFYSI